MTKALTILSLLAMLISVAVSAFYFLTHNPEAGTWAALAALWIFNYILCLLELETK